MKYRIKQYIWDLFINKFLMSYLIPITIRKIILNAINCNVRGVIHAKCRISSNRLVIGRGSYINRECLLDNAIGSISIGENCAVGFRVCIYTTNHNYNNSKRRGEMLLR